MLKKILWFLTILYILKKHGIAQYYRVSFLNFVKHRKDITKKVFINTMNKKNSKRDILLHTNTFKNQDTIIKKREKSGVENKDTINYDLSHIYGSW